MTFNEQSSRKVDYVTADKRANELLVSSVTIDGFPFKFSDLIKSQTDIRICSYAKAIRKYNVDISVFGSESAVLQEYCGYNIIFYNDEEPIYRVRFSIAHELGHYLMNHKMNLNKDDPLYHIQEKEANYFAAQLLMPAQLLRKAAMRGRNLTIEFITSSFGVSKEAAEIRKRTMSHYSSEYVSVSDKDMDELIVKKYNSYLEKIAPYRLSNYYDYDSEYEDNIDRSSWYDRRTRWSESY